MRGEEEEEDTENIKEVVEVWLSNHFGLVSFKSFFSNLLIKYTRSRMRCSCSVGLAPSLSSVSLRSICFLAILMAREMKNSV